MRNRLGVVAGCVLALVLTVAGGSALANGKYDTAKLAYSGEGAWTLDYNAALKKAKQEHKDLFVLFTGSDWCRYCKILEKNILSHAGFMDNITSDFELVFIDRPRSKNLQAKLSPEYVALRSVLSKKFGVKGAPTVVLITPDEVVYRRTSGASSQSPEAYADSAKVAKRKFRERTAIQAKVKGGRVSASQQVKLLGQLLSSVSAAEAMENYSKELDDIIRLDVGNRAGMQMKYKALVAMHNADVLLNEKHEYKKVAEMLEKELSSYKYTGNYLQELLSRESKAVLTYGHNSGKDPKLMKKGIDLMKQAVAASPNTGEAEKLRGYIKIQSRCLAGGNKVTEIQEKLKDSSIKGVERAKLLDQLLKAMRAESIFNKPLRWSLKEPYVKEIIALDPDNKAGLKKFYGRDLIERDIFRATELHHYEDIYNNLDKLLKEYGITDPAERQALVMRKARAMMLLDRSRNDVIAVLKQAYRLSPKSKDADRIRKYAKALHNPESKVKLIGLLGPELVLADGKKVEVSYLNDNSYIGIYSSAHWCGACKHFTPRLVRFRDASQKTDNKLEVVFKSSDRSPEEMFNYMKGTRMKWPAIPFASDEIAYIKKLFAIGSIPDLIIMTVDGAIITLDGRNDIARLGAKSFSKWDAAAARKRAAK